MRDTDRQISNISDLQIFARVALVGNMSAAGRVMGLSPAVVSKRVSLLEEQIGVRLFQRTTRQLTLTDVGEGLLKRAVDILSLVEEAEDFVSRQGAAPQGNLRIVAPTAFGRRYLAPALAGLQETYPMIDFDVSLSDDDVDILRHGYDIAIGYGARSGGVLKERQLATCSQVLCASPDYLDLAGRPGSVADLADHHCLSLNDRETWRLVGPAPCDDVAVVSSIRSNSADFLREALIGGAGIGLWPFWDIDDDLACGRLEIVLPDYRAKADAALIAATPCRDFVPARLGLVLDGLAEAFAERLSRADPANRQLTGNLPRPTRRSQMGVAQMAV